MKYFIKKVAVILLTLSLITSFLFVNSDSASATTIIIESYLSGVVSDEHGGAFISIHDLKTRKAYIQHMDSSGNFKWDGSGTITPYTASYNQITVDGLGGVIFVWSDTTGLYAQRIDSSGNTLWDGSGVLVHTRIGGQWPGWLGNLVVVPDKDGGAIIIWQRLENPNPIYAQRIDTTGNMAWDSSGILVAQNTYHYLQPNCISDGMGGAIIVWHEGQETVEKTFVQRLDKAGNLLWGSSGVQIGSNYSIFKTVSDENGGAIVGFNNYDEMLFIRLDYSGKIVWGEGNTTKLDPPGDVYDFQLLSDSHGGIFVVWEEAHSGWNFLRDDTNIYAQRIDSLGNILWGKHFVAICTSNGNQMEPKVISDGSGGFIVSWEDFRNNSSYVFTQRVDASGNLIWTKNGINLGRLYRPIRDFEMVSNGSGGAIIIREEGESLEPRIFSQVVDNNGAYTEPETSLYPQGLPRAKQDYEALIGSTTIYYPPQKPVWVWLIPAGIVVVILAVFLTIKKFSKRS
jgi:hypothetical protein